MSTISYRGSHADDRITLAAVTVEWAEHLVANTNAREHHFGRSARIGKQREKAKQMLHFHQVSQSLGPTPEGHRLLVTMVRLSRYPLDPGDNHTSAFKAIRDEIAAYFGLNDRHEDKLRFDCAPHLKASASSVRVIFSFEPHVPVQRAVVTEKPLATTPRDWNKRGLLKSGVVRHRT